MCGKNKVTLKIPEELYEKLKGVIDGTGFSSVTEFVVFVMRNVVSGGRIKDEDNLTKEEIQKVRDRLKRLGYI